MRGTIRWIAAMVAVLGVAAAAGAAGGPRLVLGARQELTVAARGHESPLSGPALAATGDGAVLAVWGTDAGAAAGHAHAGHGGPAGARVQIARLGPGAWGPVAVNADAPALDGLHHSPLVAVAPGGEVFVQWSSARDKPENVLFASDLRLSRSLDGGRTFDRHLRVNEDRVISHSFDGLGLLADGTAVSSWVDAREGAQKDATWVARIEDRGTRVASVARLDGDTCVCCRVAMARLGPDAVGVLWRKVFPGDVRDMVMAVSRDGARTFGSPARVHDDGWVINACPHRGGQLGADGRGRVVAAWYTEGRQGVPAVLVAASADGGRFSAPQRLNASRATVPDAVRLAMSPRGAARAVWEESTAVRRRVVARASADGGRTWGPEVALSPALKAYEPTVAVAPDGDFAVGWLEERFPTVRLVVQRIAVAP